MKTKIIILTSLICLSLLIAVSCKKMASLSTDENYSATPQLPASPDNYLASANDHMATLGRVLFYDKALSLNNSVSCASCHEQEKAFCDNQQLSTGLEDKKTSRNTPSIFAKTSPMFWDGRANSMLDLTLRPVKNHVEMKFEDLSALVSKLKNLDYYSPLFSKAFGVTAVIDSSKIQKALAEFLKNFNFSNNKFNQSNLNQILLNASEKLGKLVFFNKGQCSNCHHIEGQMIIMPGGPPVQSYGSTNGFFNIGLDELYADRGVGAISNNASDDGKFMIPALLNVEFTAPYMHDGRFNTLEEVVEHYNSGINNHPNLDFELRDVSMYGNMSRAEIRNLLDKNHNTFLEQSEMAGLPPIRLGLSSAEKKGLVDFLKTLSDYSILSNKMFSNPFLIK